MKIRNPKSEIRRLVFCLVMGICLLGFVNMAQAVTFATTGNPTDTATSTNIIAPATIETLAYQALNLTQMPTASAGSDISHIVTSEYGYSGPGAPPDLSVNPGDIVFHYYAVTNEGNANMPIVFHHLYNKFGGGSGWTVEFYLNGSLTRTLVAGVISTDATTLNDDLDSLYYYRVVVPGDAANNASVSITSTVDSASTPVSPTGYTGANSFTYGGKGTNTDIVNDSVSAPLISLTRSSTIDAPSIYAGGRRDAVPGAVVTFTMNYNNTGAASAENVVLVDKVPVNTKIAHVNTTGVTTNVTISAAQGNATGWVVKYSTLDSPSKVYGNTADWSFANGGTIGTLTAGNEMFPGGGATYQTADAPYNAKWIKWEKLYVAPAENKTLTWGVTIR